jgi:hypothetical protein
LAKIGVPINSIRDLIKEKKKKTFGINLTKIVRIGKSRTKMEKLAKFEDPINSIMDLIEYKN